MTDRNKTGHEKRKHKIMDHKNLDQRKTEHQKAKQNNDMDVDILSLSSEGQGITKPDGFTVFVEGAVPGDRAAIQILRKTKSYAIGKITRLINASPDRIQPPCPVAERCGGCNLQHMSYSAQSTWKQAAVFENMIRIGKIPRDVAEHCIEPILGMENPFFYRNHVQLAISGTPSNPQIGFYENNTHTVVDTNECLVQPPVFDTIRNIVKDFIKKQQLPIYSESTRTGLLRHLVIRAGFVTKQVMVVLVTASKEIICLNGMIQSLADEKTGVAKDGFELTGVYLNINTADTNLVLGREFQLLYGNGYIEEILCGIRYRISPSAFFQVNPVQADVLYRKTVEYAGLSPKDTVFDLYCGTGSISLVLAKYCKKVIGVEVVEQAICDAKENARINGIGNAEFFTGMAEILFPEFAAQGIEADAIVVDPPRKGLEQPVLEALVKMAPPKIVYVSCNPSTLARDCRYLFENGYELKKFQPVDLFPWTGHVETVVLMSR